MEFPHIDEPEDHPWWEMISDFPELLEGLDELGSDPEAGIVTAVGLFTMLKLRFWHRLPSALSEYSSDEHRSDDSPQPQASADKMALNT